MSSDEKSEQLSVRDGAGYDEVFGLSDEFEGFSRSSERETSAQSPDDDVESYTEENKEVMDEGEDEVEEGERENGSDGDEDEGIGKFGFVSHTKHIAEAINMNLFHS